MNAFLLWLAQGLGAGRIPIAPGTFGSLVGLLWFWLLLATGNVWIFAAGTIIGVMLAVWLCGVAEKLLRQKDPASVVLDEIVAIPVCFAGWVVTLMLRRGALPAPDYFFSKPNWLPTLGVLAAFRLFDIAKPWPVRQSQSLAGGWGVVVDDVLAAVYVNVVVLLAFGL